ncbi:small serum protein 5-like [Monodelphis domestica]|uniref:small serum protein 5-like n=1 Tax=Monodelphis domestica TaxID=13616 RepID=UPI000443356E|nr:small serum protein 5-like [Monodelphis domestica]
MPSGMERLIGLVVLCTVLALVHGNCQKGGLDVVMSPVGARPVCMDSVDNKLYKMGSRWQNSQCMQCSCTPRGVSCCESINPCS